MSARPIEPAELVMELEWRLHSDRPSALAFDGDGTLWSGDVGEDLFRFAVRHGRLREAARAQIDHEATSRGFQVFADVNATAEHLFEAYLAHRFPEREMCELMTWCFAGHTVPEMTQLSAEALQVTGHAERLHQELAPVLKFAQKRGLRTIVVSASPRAIVELAASAWGFAPADIAASTPIIVSGVIAPRMDGALPYAAAKCVAGRALLGTTHWLASFGDNVFDIEMLVEAEVGVAVRPKPALRARLAEVPGVLVLAAPD
jgi:phosphatidylglycerophosphatase C